MTEPDLPPPAGTPSPLDDLDGFTIEQLSDYLDRGRLPMDPAIEASAAAQHALAALGRLRAVAPKVMEAEAAAAPPRAPSWFKAILEQIGVQANAGRDIPLRHEDPRTLLAITEGAVRAIIRTAGDDLDGLLVERSRLTGNVDERGAPVTVEIDVSLYAGADADLLLAQLGVIVRDALARHTELNVAGVEVRVRDWKKEPEDLE
jgi:hypothetical protein